MMDIKKKKKILTRKRLFCIITIIIATISLGIGYAQITKELDVVGTAQAIAEKIVMITNTEYISDVGADLNNSTIDFNKTILTNKVVLSNNDLSSSITYKIKIKNNSPLKVKYQGPLYSVGSGYDNQDIVFNVSGIAIDDLLDVGEEKEITITFSYDPNLTQITNNILNSIINLKFDFEYVVYYASSVSFDGTVNSIVDTGIELYSAENVNKNYLIKFTVESYNNAYDTPSNIDNNNAPTIISDMLETNQPYPGAVFRVYKVNGKSAYNCKINDSHITSYVNNKELEPGLNVEIARENGKMYYKIGSNIYTTAVTYNASIDTFNIPLTIGGSINENGEYFRPFNGTLKDVVVMLYENETFVNNTCSYTESRTATSYTLDGSICFDGTNYIDTGINVYTTTNESKNFDIKFTINEFASSNVNQATIVNVKDETQNNVWPGVAYRHKGSNRFEMTGRWPPSTSTTTREDTNSLPRTVEITRRAGVIYYKFQMGNTTQFLSTPVSALSNPFDATVSFGASKKNPTTAQRYFKGIISDISFNMYDP